MVGNYNEKGGIFNINEMFCKIAKINKDVVNAWKQEGIA
jgi:hypothetical protein